MAPQPVSFEQLQTKQGQSLGTSDWIHVDQTRIDNFADATQDWQFIHVDPERAQAETPFGGTIAHGLLSLSLLPPLGADVIPLLDRRAMAINCGLDKVRFMDAVPRA